MLNLEHMVVHIQYKPLKGEQFSILKRIIISEILTCLGGPYVEKPSYFGVHKCRKYFSCFCLQLKVLIFESFNLPFS